MKIVVVGGTGLIGSKLVRYLTQHGHQAVAASPNTGVNTLTCQGLAEVLKDVPVIVDVSNSPSWEEEAVMNFFKTSTTNLLKYGSAAGVGHLIALSVVGTDRLTESPYFRAKLAQEKLIQESGMPYSIVRATQFFEFAKGIAEFSTQGGQVHLPPVFIQPMASDDVARSVASVSVASPLNGIVEIGGPEKFRLDELIRLYLSAIGDRREVVTDPNSLYYGIHVSERTLVPESNAKLGEIRFKDWLKPRSLENRTRRRGGAGTRKRTDLPDNQMGNMTRLVIFPPRSLLIDNTGDGCRRPELPSAAPKLAEIASQPVLKVAPSLGEPDRAVSLRCSTTLPKAC
jgi:uncharacterized protein YbjT (DUF2867 family)